MKILFDMLTYSDAKALRSWWNAFTLEDHEIRRSETNPRYWMLVRL